MSNAGFHGAAQSVSEQTNFIEAFARVRLLEIIDGLRPRAPIVQAVEAAERIHPDWDNIPLLIRSGLFPDDINDEMREGTKFLHIDVAAASPEARAAFLVASGLSDKQQRDIFPRLYAAGGADPTYIEKEVQRLNRHLSWLYENHADTSLFPTYHGALEIHGRTQNISGSVGAMGSAMTFLAAIREIDPDAVADVVGEPPPDGTWASPEQTVRWMRQRGASCTVKAILLQNGRALVFSSSKDANIFMNLGAAYDSAERALRAFTAVRDNQARRHQVMHEFAVGEVKTATDPANLHERLGLASRETQTELRTDRFLMMALLTPEILAGGRAGRVMNNRDLTRFSHVFNLHHCWGWDGGRERNAAHWDYFKECVGRWCGL